MKSAHSTSRYLLVAILMVTSLLIGGVRAQSAEEPWGRYPVSVDKYLRRIQKGKQQFAFDSSRDFDSWSDEARAQLIERIGLKRMQTSLSRFEPNVNKGESKSVGDVFSRSLCTIETEPGVSVPFYLLVPNGSNPQQRFPLFLCPHGHDSQGLHSYSGVFSNEKHRNEILARDGNIAEQAVRRGFVVIAPATRGLARETEIPDLNGRHGKRTCRAQLMHCLVAGRTPVAERVWDMQRLLDWAVKQPNVDARQIVMTGNSGGGVVTAYVAAIDTRVTVAIPSCSFTSVASADGYIFHCDCCIVPGLRDWGGWRELGGLVAPRHLLIIHGKQDRLHHRQTVESLVESIRPIFHAAGDASRLSLRWGGEGHRFYPSLMWPFIESALRQ